MPAKITPPRFYSTDNQWNIKDEPLSESIFMALSHSGQEVFQSDFLAYLANHQPVFFKAVMRALGLPDGYGRVEREWKRFDLAFFVAPKAPVGKKEREPDAPYLVIENKFKSLPNEEQIAAYRRKLKAYPTKFYFLTLFNADSKGVGHTSTPSIIYRTLVEKMSANITLISESTPDGSFIRELVGRYISFITSIDNYIKPFVEYDEERLKSCLISDYFLLPKSIADDRKSLCGPVKELQLSSLIKKMRMSLLCSLLRRRLKAADIDWNDGSDRVRLASGMTSNKSLVECWLNIGEAYEVRKGHRQYLYRYFIQFDDGNINHGIQVNTPEGRQIQIALRKEKSSLKRNLALSLTDIAELKPLKDLVESLRPQNDSDRTPGFNNMIYTRLYSVKDLDKNVVEGLDMMARQIIDTYNRLYKN